MLDGLEMIEQHVTRHHGHPWDTSTRKGFDLLEAEADNQNEILEFVEKAKNKFWQPWLVANVPNEQGKYGAALYKPCGIKEDWHDSPEKPHPGIEEKNNE